MKTYPSPFCGLRRRQFLRTGIAGALGWALSPGMQRLLAAEGSTRRATACILLWLNGGPSHIDTFDPKPGEETGGPFKTIDTAVPGLRFSEHFPKLAQQAKQLAVVRSLSSKEEDHERAYEFMHTGNQRSESVDYPALGSVVAHEAPWEGDLPPFVALNGGAAGPGFLGFDFAPYVIANVDAPLENVQLPEGVNEERLARRLKALAAFNRGATQRITEKAVRLRKSPALRAFALKDEPATLLARYGVAQRAGENTDGNGAFGKACLVARRLVEHGVRFVEVTLDGWDTHADNFNTVKALAGQLDPAFAALTEDLTNRGLLEETLVICVGEFGRTPKINANNGRDHWADAFSAVLAGGGVRGGQAIGSTDNKGATVKDRPISVADLYATVLAALGIDGRKVYRAPGGRPIKLAAEGRIVTELLG